MLVPVLIRLPLTTVASLDRAGDLLTINKRYPERARFLLSVNVPTAWPGESVAPAATATESLMMPVRPSATPLATLRLPAPIEPCYRDWPFVVAKPPSLMIAPPA